MSKYVIDSYAWIEYFEGSAKGRVVQKVILEKHEIITSAVTVAEVISRMKRKGFEVDDIYLALTNLSQIEDTHALDAKDVGLIHAELRSKVKDFGLADAFVLAVAHQHDAKIITGDPHFKHMKNVIFLG